MHFPGIIFGAANMGFLYQNINIERSIRASKSFNPDHQDHLILTSSITVFFVESLLETIKNSRGISNFPLKTHSKRMVLEHLVHVYRRLKGFNKKTGNAFTILNVFTKN